ncbi:MULTISPECIES: HAD-IIA family hydrolase [unclassified Nitratiruptor]|uniref:HAD-IIA family hydrolase n=1 Tax=unclassified Nitratiruptor TaxID=2624044 RepID=UPI00191561E6|nr:MULTISPECIES: HAD-IIA family hydrolase [unclassified Nitratiruptor]BCD59725.1 NagD protein [Nitratiruptor sp. YY08-10]BCD63649.1 NagD protein [Nitratiruptor sp. YY08-14]
MKFFIDVQGTLIDDKERKPIAGSIECIQALNEKNIPYIIITNNTKHSSQEFLNYLNSLGFPIPKERYIDPLMVLEEVLPKESIAPYGVEGFLQVLQSMGYRFDYHEPKAVVISVKNDYTFDEFAQIDELLLQGASLIGMHQTSLYAKGEKRYPGVGALLAMFEYACGVQSQVVGKPSKLFYKKALKKVGGKFGDVVIISDDPQGDLIGAKKLGMKTVFVLSGKYKSAKEIVPKLPKEYRPDLIYDTIAQAAKALGVL